MCSASDLRWVGHRGWPERFPENSLVGVEAALLEGAHAVEVDVQFSADGEPVVLHDATLQRVAGVEGRADALEFETLKGISVHEPSRFAERFAPILVPHLADFLQLMQRHPDRTLFIEIKPDVFDRIERQWVLERLAKDLQDWPHDFYLISYDEALLHLAQDQYGWSVGWVLRHYDDATQRRALDRPVDVMICDLRKIPATSVNLWQGPWDWFVYDVVEPQDIQRCRDWGVRWLETWDIGRVLRMSQVE